jgi:hypothetical protein
VSKWVKLQSLYADCRAAFLAQKERIVELEAELAAALARISELEAHAAERNERTFERNAAREAQP